MEGEERVKLAMILSCVMLFGCSEINKRIGVPDDNFAEETVEVVIYSKTGLDVDLTPDSPE